MPSQLRDRAKVVSSWVSAKSKDLKKVRGVCFDIDDTFSTEGKITAEAFASLWLLKKSGFAVVPVTGRPAGWCDHIARFWPVDAVVGENGAFTFFMENGVRKRIDTPAGTSPKELKTKLDLLAQKIKSRFPKAVWASDTPYREYDLAIDICEDVPAWDPKEVDELLELCAREGAQAKLSSIHVNTWFGSYEKRKGFEFWISQGSPGLKSKKVPLDQWLFIGDSPNDEPLFESFRFSVGVANLKKYLPRLKHPPRWMTSGESGRGFSQMVKKLVETR